MSDSKSEKRLKFKTNESKYTPTPDWTYGVFPEFIIDLVDKILPPPREILSSADKELIIALQELPKNKKYSPHKEIKKKEKTKAIKKRRHEFSKNRHQLMLLMLDSGIPYICAHAECTAMESLEVDHIHPISKGGTDDIKNLQFLCKQHNSAKGDRVKK